MTAASRNIALFTDTYDEVNGVANTFRHLTEFCRRTGRRLDIYAHTEDEDSVEELDTVRIRRYKPAIPVDIYFDMIFDLKVARYRVFKQAMEARYDLIHTATPGSMGLNALIVARQHNTPLIGSYHTSLPEYVRTRVERLVERFRLPTEHSGRRSENLTWAYMCWYYNHCRAVLAPSHYTAETLRERLEAPVDIFTRGIDTERFHPRFRQSGSEVTVLYVGRVSAEKNLNVLTDIFRDRHDARLVIVGDGPYREEMQRALPHADFRGFLKGEELSAAYASADIFAFPSTTDTFGNVVVEAMSSGVPVVVTDKMGPREQVAHGRTGFITTDAEDFAARLDELIGDAGLRQRMGRAAREYALSRSWDAVFEHLFRQYEAAAAGPYEPPPLPAE